MSTRPRLFALVVLLLVAVPTGIAVAAPEREALGDPRLARSHVAHAGTADGTEPDRVVERVEGRPPGFRTLPYEELRPKPGRP
jgi:hypothetical protein